MKTSRPWPLLAVASGMMLIGASQEWVKNSNTLLSAAFATAGMICLGAWLTLEVQVYRRMLRDWDREDHSNT